MKMTSTAVYDWVPNVGVGPVRFGDPVSKHRESLSLRSCNDPFDERKFDCYAFGEQQDPAYYLDEQGAVESIVCFESLLLDGTDLLSLSLTEIVDILGMKPDEIGDPIELDDNDVQIAVEFDQFGLQVWFRDDIAVSAVVDAFENED